LAQGRVLSDKPQPPLKLFKFSRPKGGAVNVVDAHEMTAQWFGERTQRVNEELQKVLRALQEAGG
jgi:hypothetical protein